MINEIGVVPNSEKMKMDTPFKVRLVKPMTHLLIKGCNSAEEGLLWEQEVGGSNPLILTVIV